MNLDKTLLPAAEALRALVIAELETAEGVPSETLYAADCFTAEELELVLRTVRDAIVAPVLAIHVPAVNDRWCAGCSHPTPCPTVTALGVGSPS